MRDRHPRKAPDFTAAALVMGFVNLLWIFIVLWAVFGYWSVLATGVVLNAAITHLGSKHRSG